MKLRIVLVEPREAGNVGAAARVMRNFGFADLWIVGRHPELHPLAWWWASGAEEVVEKATFVATLQEALSDAHVSIATTSARGRDMAIDMTPAGVAASASELTAEQTLALVFGREDSGLTREEVVLCQRTAIIPTTPAFPTMNLAQSIGIFCYELSDIQPASQGRILPSAGLVERLHERAEALLFEVGFLRENNPHLYQELRTLVARAALDERELTIVLGILRQIEWKLKNGSGS
ncbi:MAG: RNA methyltransferase [Acidobacteriota bacterium]